MNELRKFPAINIFIISGFVCFFLDLVKEFTKLNIIILKIFFGNKIPVREITTKACSFMASSFLFQS